VQRSGSIRNIGWDNEETGAGKGMYEIPYPYLFGKQMSWRGYELVMLV
jgi:hypothetical protein